MYLISAPRINFCPREKDILLSLRMHGTEKEFIYIYVYEESAA